MSSEEEALQQFEEMNEIGKDIEAIESQQTEEESVSHVTPHMLATALQPLSRMLARKTGIRSVELTDEDVKDLEMALQPLNLAVLEKVSKYLPITIFAVGYLLRIFLEIREKKKSEKKEEEAEKKLVYIPKKKEEEDIIQEVYVVPPLPKTQELNPQNSSQEAEVEKEEKKVNESSSVDKAGA